MAFAPAQIEWKRVELVANERLCDSRRISAAQTQGLLCQHASVLRACQPGLPPSH